MTMTSYDTSEVAIVLSDDHKEVEASGVTMEHDERVVLDPELWKDFPFELHGLVLRFLSMPELCRLRVVCRAWNELTHTLNFSLQARSSESLIFKAPISIELSLHDFLSHIGDIDEESTDVLALYDNWEVIDPVKPGVYPIDVSFLYDDVHDRFECLDRCDVLAAHKGFVCVLWRSRGPVVCDVELLQVVNPIIKSVVELPPFPNNIAYDYQGLMTVADDYSSFTLYIITIIKDQERPCLVRFDSHVGEWREILGLPSKNLIPSYMLKLNEVLYIIFCDDDGYRLYALDTAINDALTDTNVELPKVIVPQLATALGRLFFEGFSANNGIVIYEIDLALRRARLLTRMDESKLLGVVDCSPVYGQPYLGRGGNTAVLGWSNFIVIISNTGGSIAYDLVNDTWSEWDFEQYRIVDPVSMMSEERCGLYAMTMPLTLNPVPVPRPLPQQD